MRRLNNLLMVLLVILIIIIIGGVATLFVKTTPSKMQLISSSLFNTIVLKSNNKEDDIQEVNDDVKIENEQEVKQEEKTTSQNEINDKKEEIDTDNTKDQELDNLDIYEDVVVAEEVIKEEIVVKGEYSPNLEVASSNEVIETYYGKMTGYGPDCVGCSGITASGMNVLNGNIYYEDETYGNIRIVAGDKSIPFGSIIRITGTTISTEPILAIVLDRGGMIGFETWKHSYFDLLYESEQAAIPVGRQDATFELLRLGY